jgi:farnesyl diphosphate synthase
MNINELLQISKQQLETFLAQVLPIENINTQDNSDLFTATRYATLNGGKRLRPALVYATGAALGIQDLSLLNAAAASVELIHCYSLIHDDLPAMDNDDLRRGKPSCHKAFNEATAILAGDALQTLAFELLSDPILNPCTAEIRIQMVNVLAKAIGTHGMILGQGEDLAAENKCISLEQLIQLHKHKTGALIKAAIHLASLAANCQKPAIIQALLHYGDCLGLAFQVYDDILDITTDTITLGKPANSDQRNNKATFPSLLGLEQAKQYALTLQQDAITALEIFEDTAAMPLQELARYFVQRKN